MELRTVAEMKAYIEMKFTTPTLSASALPVSQRRKNPDYTVFTLGYAEKDGTPRPEFDGLIRCYKNGVTSVA